MTVRFRLLGPVAAHIGDRLVDVGPARQRSVLGALLVDANRCISVDQLVERVWGGNRLPDRPRNAVQTYISLLRRALGVAEDLTIARQPDGYVINVDERRVDLHEFRLLAQQARAADETGAAVLFERALGLWNGEAFGVLDTPWLNDLRAALSEERQAAERDLTDIQLRLGRHGALLAQLSEWADARPLDERLAGQLMLALFRSGRQADALRHYQRIRQQLADELGADPGQPLQLLHQRILTHDPSLAAASNGDPVSASAPPPVPRQLPAAPGLFTGRADELARLDQTLGPQAAPGGTVVISAIGGAGGIGKTWLALHWAHRNLSRFPDGQLYVNLRGFDPSGEPLPAVTAIRGFLDALGVEPAAVPGELSAQAGLYRSLLADKRMLIVLDNARDSAQVAPLLPGSATCTVLVTSRSRLSGLAAAHGARPLTVDVLPESEARQLLAARVGVARVAAEPEVFEELLACCGGLPLALSIVAARAEAHPQFPLAELGGDLSDAATRLAALDDYDSAASLPSVLSWSYAALPPEQARVFGLLGLAPGPDIGLLAAASLTALPTGRVRALLRELENASLVQQHSPGRYRMHDLVRLYAAQASNDQPEAARTDALHRVTDFYLHTAFAGERMLYPHRDLIRLEDPAVGCNPGSLDDKTAAIAWFTAEHPNLLAAQQLAAERRWHAPAWQLAWALDTFHRRQGRLHDPQTMWRIGIAAADQFGDAAIQILARRRVASASSRAGHQVEALQCLREALTLAEHTGDALGQAHTRYSLAITWSRCGDTVQALEHATEALHLFQTLETPTWEANALNQVGSYQAMLGGHTRARALCEAALHLFRRQRDRLGEASALDSLGYIAHLSGRHAQAPEYYRQALAIQRDLGDTYEQANTLDRLAQAHHALGRPDQARDTWEQALKLYQAQHRTAAADRIQHQLAHASRSSGDRGSEDAQYVGAGSSLRPHAEAADQRRDVRRN